MATQQKTDSAPAKTGVSAEMSGKSAAEIRAMINETSRLLADAIEREDMDAIAMYQARKAILDRKAPMAIVEAEYREAQQVLTENEEKADNLHQEHAVTLKAYEKKKATVEESKQRMESELEHMWAATCNIATQSSSQSRLVDSLRAKVETAKINLEAAKRGVSPATIIEERRQAEVTERERKLKAASDDRFARLEAAEKLKEAAMRNPGTPGTAAALQGTRQVLSSGASKQ